MAKSECICENFSCESCLDKKGNDYVISDNHRFRFVKDNGAITSEIVIDGIIHKSGPFPGDIPSCEIRERKKRGEILAEKKVEIKTKKKEKKNKIVKKRKRRN